jgi:hypothetical protein
MPPLDLYRNLRLQKKGKLEFPIWLPRRRAVFRRMDLQGCTVTFSRRRARWSSSHADISDDGGALAFPFPLRPGELLRGRVQSRGEAVSVAHTCH